MHGFMSKLKSLLNKIDKDIQFKEHEQDIVEKNIEWIFKNSMIFTLKIQ